MQMTPMSIYASHQAVAGTAAAAAAFVQPVGANAHHHQSLMYDASALVGLQGGIAAYDLGQSGHQPQVRIVDDSRPYDDDHFDVVHL